MNKGAEGSCRQGGVGAWCPAAVDGLGVVAVFLGSLSPCGRIGILMTAKARPHIGCCLAGIFWKPLLRCSRLLCITYEQFSALVVLH